MGLLDRCRGLCTPRLQALNTFWIDPNAIVHNLRLLQARSGSAKIFPVLKSNAYGHGLKEVASILKETDVPYICVDSLPEAYLVRKYAKKASLLIGETLPENYTKMNPSWVTPCVYNTETLKALISTSKSRKIHLFLNTGMNREGIQLQDIGVFLDLLAGSKIQLEGVMSHFANADETDSSFCETQVSAFKNMMAVISEAGISVQYTHIQNSAGVAKISDSFFTACRAGISLYGYSPLTEIDPYVSAYTQLKPSLTCTSTVVSLQTLHAGDLVSYGGTWKATGKATVATIPFGYTEGLDRRLRGKWHVKWNDHYLPVIGTICMNLCIIDTTGYDVKLGDTVEVISPYGKNSVAEFAKAAETIPYEVVVNLDTKARRRIK